MPNRRYHTLVCREDHQWAIQFGDYDRACVQEEMADYADSGSYRRKDMKIITSGDLQAEINAAVDALNVNWRKGE